MKNLVIFNFWCIPEVSNLSEDSNSWYIKNYESYFDEVNFLLLSGSKKAITANGKSKFISVGGNGNSKLDLLLSPFRLYRFIKKSKSTHIITYEQTFLWWMGLFVKIFLRKKIFLIPQAYPEEMHKLTGKSLTYKYPIWVDKILLNLSYRFCSVLLTSKGAGELVNSFKKNRILKKKLVIADSLPEIVAFPPFMKSLEAINKKFEIRKKEHEPYILICVSRLISEKKVDHLIKALPILLKNKFNVELRLIGSGNEKDNLVLLAKELKVENEVKFLGFFQNGELPHFLNEADLFLSPLSGASLREAAICGMPIIAYNIDWIRGYVTHKYNIYSVDTIDYVKFAEGIMELLNDIELRKSLSINIKSFAEAVWSPKNINSSLKKIFG